MKKGAACRYKIVFPKEAAEEDKIKVNIKSLDNITLYAIDTPKWSSEDFKETKPITGDSVTITYPSSLFLTFLSDRKLRDHGDFEVNYKFIPSGKKLEGPFVGSLNFIILVGVASFIVVVIMVALFIYLCVTCRVNKKLEL